ncbi:MAG: ABC transporter ATP-binding protein [Candidatus Competibacterales bacterium]
MLAIRDLDISLPPGADRPLAVAGLQLELHPAEILCVVGESGSGKSLTAKAVMGLLPPPVRATRGEIRLEGEDLLQATPGRMRQVRGEAVGMIFQEPMTALNPLHRIGDQIDEVLRTHTKQSRRQRKARIVELLTEVQLPDPRAILQAYPHQLSGGQRQRAMIAMALILEPRVLIADEPTTALDVTTQAQILKLIKDLQDEFHSGVLFITHDFGVVAEIADRVAVMQHGELVEVGTAAEVLHQPRHPYTRDLIAAVPSLTPRRPALPGDAPVVLEVSDLRKTYHSGGGLWSRGRTVAAVQGVSLGLRRGETVGVVGESGSGKSTLARCIVRLIEPDAGAVVVDGVDLLPLAKTALKPYRRRIQMVFQDPYGSLNPRYKVGRLIAEGPLVNGVPRREAQRRTEELLALVGLPAQAAHRYPHEFSGGQRQRIGIARALALEPEILIADEPVSALDVSVQAQVLELLADLQRRFQLAMVFITHDLRVAAQVCDRVAVMQRGEVVEFAATKQLFEDPRHPYTQALLASVPGKGWRGLAGLEPGRSTLTMID